MDNSDSFKFERLNFFKGMFTTAEDWKLEQDYHRKKLQLENRVLRNIAGIVEGEGEELEVKVDDTRSRVEVGSGAAVDPMGNLLYLVEPDSCELPKITGNATVYVAIKYHETKRQYVIDPVQPDYSGYRRVQEKPYLRASTDPIDNHTEVELAHVEFKVNNGKVSHEVIRPAFLSPTLKHFDKELAEEQKKSAKFEERLAQLDDHSRIRSRGLHTPGIIHTELEEFRVQAVGGLNVSVHAGAALDNQGNTIVLGNSIPLSLKPVDTGHDLVYIVIRHNDGRPSVTTKIPDNLTTLELARIDLHLGAKEIKDASDPDNPGPNEINLHGRRWAGAVGVVEETMSPQTLQRVIQVMEPTRRNFAALADRFPTTSMSDVRHSALTVATLARVGCIPPGKLHALMTTLAGIQRDVGNEIFRKYDTIVSASEEFRQYRSSVTALLAALRGTEDDILTAQSAVANAAQVLAMTDLENPMANAGSDQHIRTLEDEATVTLDAHLSKGHGGRDIDWFTWNLGT